MPNAKVFWSGNSQAVRLPKGFRFTPGTDEVAIRREGESLILEPIPRQRWPEEFWGASTGCLKASSGRRRSRRIARRSSPDLRAGHQHLYLRSQEPPAGGDRASHGGWTGRGGGERAHRPGASARRGRQPATASSALTARPLSRADGSAVLRGGRRPDRGAFAGRSRPPGLSDWRSGQPHRVPSSGPRSDPRHQQPARVSARPRPANRKLGGLRPPSRGGGPLPIL